MQPDIAEALTAARQDRSRRHHPGSTILEATSMRHRREAFLAFESAGFQRYGRMVLTADVVRLPYLALHCRDGA